ncbi:transcription-repair coupling factor [Pseudothermotoga sp. U03pept]|uniref:transcription-repair coupling factor n=1 Tax=Pseudothermotoga sp. U03pept TaxID=3447012 RepID=UPI003F06A988
MTIDDLLKRLKDRDVLIIVPTEHDAHLLASKYNFLYFPSHDVFPFEEISVSFSVRRNRIEVLWGLLNGSREVIVSTLHAISRKTFSPEQLRKFSRTLKIGDRLYDFGKYLYELGYERAFLVRTQGEFSVRGDIIDFFGPLYDKPVRVELFGDMIESLRFFDAVSQRSIMPVDEITLLPAREYVGDLHSFDTVPGKAGSNSTIFEYADFRVLVADFDRCQEEFVKREKESREILDKELLDDYVENSQIRLSELVKFIGSFTPIEIDLGELKVAGKISQVEQAPILSEEDLNIGDYVVHKDYGIGVYRGVERIHNALGIKEYVVIKYEDSMIYVPVETLDRVHKYLGDTESVKIDRLNSHSWKRRVDKVRKNLKEKIQQLVQIYTKRQEVWGLGLAGDEMLEREFARTFPYIETQDQLVAVEEVLSDLVSDKPMDRLLCGDAGYGKTEVAMRAAFRCVVSGKQVAILVPTTVLAKQHYKTFRERMEPFGIVVEIMERSTSKSQRARILEKLRNGDIDVIVGTHSLLSDELQFSDLGLVIIDEEQNFGVEQKEKFKKLRINVNVLTLSATPIPRTLHMALTGMKDMSVLQTPPLGRQPVITYVARYSDQLVRAAILREINRGGQVIYVHNRINDIQDVYEKVKKIVPQVRIVVAHGRMSSKKLSEAVRSFYENRSDVIVCTSILENGIDIPNANTLIVDDSHRYGLAQLYQLRGRVGRSDRRAFAYFLYDSEVEDKATRRLQVIRQFSGPGSGLQLAIKDMQMRGIGSVFGLEQHGMINEIGLNLYTEILQEQLREARKERSEDDNERVETQIEGIPGELIIPSYYVENPMERMRIYRRLASCRNLEELDDISLEMRDRFGEYPEQVTSLLDLFKIRIIASKRGIRSIKYTDNTLQLQSEKQLEIDICRKYLYNERLKSYFFYDIEPEDVFSFLKALLSRD